MSDLIVTPGFTKSGLPYVIFDNVFSDNELSRMMLEIDLNIKPVMRRENTGGTEKKHTNAVFLHEIFNNPEASNIYLNTRKYLNDIIMDKLSDTHWVFTALKGADLKESIQILYYEDKDNYGQHTDISLMTMLFWAFKQPKGFEGGDIILDDDVTIECKCNRALAMSLRMPHEVTPVKYTADVPNRGRYCISNFYNYHVL
jgi:hypothetical protein